jgi:hypothetical protein
MPTANVESLISEGLQSFVKGKFIITVLFRRISVVPMMGIFIQ